MSSLKTKGNGVEFFNSVECSKDLDALDKQLDELKITTLDLTDSNGNNTLYTLDTILDLNKFDALLFYDDTINETLLDIFSNTITFSDKDVRQFSYSDMRQNVLTVRNLLNTNKVYDPDFDIKLLITLNNATILFDALVKYYNIKSKYIIKFDSCKHITTKLQNKMASLHRNISRNSSRKNTYTKQINGTKGKNTHRHTAFKNHAILYEIETGNNSNNDNNGNGNNQSILPVRVIKAAKNRLSGWWYGGEPSTQTASNRSKRSKTTKHRVPLRSNGGTKMLTLRQKAAAAAAAAARNINGHSANSANRRTTTN